MSLKLPLVQRAWHSSQIQDAFGQHVATAGSTVQAQELIRRTNTQAALVQIVKDLMPHVECFARTAGTSDAELVLARAREVLAKVEAFGEPQG